MTDTADSSRQWLEVNRALRMDATETMFSHKARAIHLARYRFAQGYCAGKRVLDAACGTGYGTQILACVAHSAVGIDSSGEAIDYARSKYAGDNAAFEVSFVEMTPFAPGAFDVVVSFETIEHTLCPHSHIREIARLLNPAGGLAILSVPNGWGLTDHHFFDFDLHLLRQVLEPYFRRIEYFAQTPGEDNGTGSEIIAGTPAALSAAYCIVSLCREPVVQAPQPDVTAIMDEIYRAAFARHNDYRALEYRVKTGLMKRIVNRAKIAFGRSRADGRP